MGRRQQDSSQGFGTEVQLGRVDQIEITWGEKLKGWFTLPTLSYPFFRTFSWRKQGSGLFLPVTCMIDRQKQTERKGTKWRKRKKNHTNGLKKRFKEWLIKTMIYGSVFPAIVEQCLERSESWWSDWQHPVKQHSTVSGSKAVCHHLISTLGAA